MHAPGRQCITGSVMDRDDIWFLGLDSLNYGFRPIKGFLTFFLKDKVF